MWLLWCVQPASEDRHDKFALLTCEGKKLEAVLKPALLSDFRDDTEVLLDFGCAELDPELTVFRKFCGKDGSKPALANGYATAMDWCSPGGVGRDTDANIYFSAQKSAHRS